MRLPWWVPLGRVPEIAPTELVERMRQRPWPQILDVRTGIEFAGGHVRGAINVPVMALISRLDALDLDPTRPVVAICLTAHRSAPAVRFLRQRGFEASQLAGGMTAWRAHKLPEGRS